MSKSSLTEMESFILSSSTITNKDGTEKFNP